jgi:hypothetical protein
LVITGNLGYFPTAEGIEWWLRAVWPEVRRRFEGVRLRLSGARPSRSLERLARAAGAELQASPPDLRAVLREATIALAPARCGSGLPLKVLEAWAQGVPVVATRWTASGAAAVADRDLLVADTPAEWVAALGRLLGDRTLGVRLVRCGREKLRAEYDARQLASSLDGLVEEWRRAAETLARREGPQPKGRSVKGRVARLDHQGGIAQQGPAQERVQWPRHHRTERLLGLEHRVADAHAGERQAWCQLLVRRSAEAVSSNVAEPSTAAARSPEARNACPRVSKRGSTK